MTRITCESQLPIHKALTWPMGQSAWALGTSLVGEDISRNKVDLLNKVFRSDLLPLGIKRSSICVGKTRCITLSMSVS